MKIDFIEISNFKSFNNVKLTFNENNTFLAGANNAGKTSLLEYIYLVLNGYENIKEDDIPVDEKCCWLKIFNRQIAKIIDKSSDIDEFSVEINKLFNDNNVENQFIALKLPTINIQISYNEKENISLFAPFIMELDSEQKIFNFKIKYKLNKNLFIKSLIEFYPKLKKLIVNAEVPYFTNDKIDIHSFFINNYLINTEIQYYYTNRTFDDSLSNFLSATDFKSLFNCEYKSANRLLDDNRDDNNKFLSSKIIDSISDTSDFDNQTEGLADKISEYINSPNFKKVIEHWSTNEINKNIKIIKNDLQNNNIQEIKLSYNIMKENIYSLLKKVVGAKFIYDRQYELKEYSQGLGFSNYIYLCLCLQIYRKNMNDKKVNLFIIEEPESHMHPQMQRSFLNYIENYTRNNSFQIMISTHSTEFIKQIDIKNVRVIKKIDKIKSKLYDLGEFFKKLTNDEDKKFYSTAFRINLADAIFAEKCIVFEGDCEKLLLTKALQLHNYKSLGNNYISLIQVGSAYAFQYYNFLNFIELKTLYICDIDYELKRDEQNEIIPTEIFEVRKSQTTNQSLIEFYNVKFNKKVKECDELFKWDGSIDNNTKVVFQGELDGYGRTLEEALFYKLFNMSVFSKYSRSFLLDYKNKMKLNLIISNKGKITAHQLLESNINNKVNFVLSLIFTNTIAKAIPNYIDRGLKWLTKN